MSQHGNHADVGQGGAKLPWLTSVLVGLAALSFLLAGPAPEFWVFDRAAIDQGEWWRLLSAHWVHSDAAHLAWNLGAFAILGGLLEHSSRRGLLIGLLLGTLAVDLGVWFLLPGLDYYCGLSGVLNTLLVPVLYAAWRRTRHPVVSVTAFVAAIKLIVELGTQQAVLTHAAWPSVPEAHLAGAIAGVLAVAAGVSLRQVAE